MIRIDIHNMNQLFEKAKNKETKKEEASGELLRVQEDPSVFSSQELADVRDRDIDEDVTNADPAMEALLKSIEKLERKSPQKRYAPEKIHYEDQTEESRYLRFQKMRRIGSVSYFTWDYYRDSAKQFYDQARFMADYEEDEDACAPCRLYRPVYADMNDDQLQTYFAWRTKVRKGQVDKTSRSYGITYLYELLNQIHTKSPMDALEQMILFWKAYRVYDDSFDTFLPRWVKEFYICHDISVPYGEIQAMFPERKGEASYDLDQVRKEILEGNYNNILWYLNQESTYKILESRFYQGEWGYTISQMLPYVLRRLDTLFAQKDLSFGTVLAGEPVYCEHWQPLRDAVCYDTKPAGDREVSFGKYEIYSYKAGRWSCYKISGYQSGRGLIGHMLKLMEAKTRELTHFKYKLKPNGDTALSVGYYKPAVKRLARSEAFEQAVYAGVMDYWQESGLSVKTEKKQRGKKQKTGAVAAETLPQTVEIDLTKLEDIRNASQRLQEKLVVEEETVRENRELIFGKESEESRKEIFTEEVLRGKTCSKEEAKQETLLERGTLSPKEAETKESSNQAAQGKLQFTLEEKLVLEVLLFDGDPAEGLRRLGAEKGILPEVIEEQINEKTLDVLGDSVLEGAEIYEEYRQIVLDLWKGGAI